MNVRHLVAAASVVFAVAVLVVWANPALLITGYDHTTVTVEDAATDETLATVDVRVADTTLKRYVGLSATESLGPDEGMLFVHVDPAERAYVMRDMAFAIDIVFVDADGTITTIHSAEPEDRPYTEYAGYGQYVLEVRYGYMDDHGIEEGDRIVIAGEY